MSFPGGGGDHPALSAHSDVLKCDLPSTPEGARALVSELKDRARNVMASGNYPLAEFLYGRAVEVMSGNGGSGGGYDGAERESAVLYANRSLARLNQTRSEGAISDAALSISHDPSYVKGYWRLGSACFAGQKYGEALEAFQSGLEADPGNKPFERELQRCRQKMAEAGKKKKKRGASKPVAAPAPAPPVPTRTATNKSAEAGADAGVGGEFSVSDHVRGYKIVNGKKTSFFHHEQSEEAKALIGDITPKMIDAAVPVRAPAGAGGEEKGAAAVSAWNTAGTWEERDVTPWATGSLTSVLEGLAFDVPPSAATGGVTATASVAAATKVEGHASFATVRGKRRYMYEFSIELSWTLANAGCSSLAKGQLLYPDVDGTCAGTFESTMVVKEVGDVDLTGIDGRALAKRFVGDGGLKDVVDAAFDRWIETFKETYPFVGL
mmetsp:Transcript_34346/g.67566  ORF Transcript_34346/g.67566 Transcript_34346/m.67566 type:complete len:437 (+) Transcript_34346:86-1396(+)|eukprot:CAMPEP_0194306664 /NCGR_PEP_ID=MMETSP0171-20130528/3730_1 /TAXON_ID=218684 /ORGANISM="Corethron pennatum, Strain L29A3" /LENGTH=436 /DNA_ID=CAMNT_0039058493 /DNA_START=55 /DNA_END=1365 /DNA_ORIENTATION=+